MVDFENLMEALPLRFDYDDERAEEYWYSNEFLLEPIYDGKRLQCLIDENNNVSFKTLYKDSVRRVLDDKFPNLIKELKLLPKNTLLDGYLSCGSFDETMVLLERDFENIEDNENRFNTSFIVMDMIYHNDEEIYWQPLFNRKEIISRLIGFDYIKIIDSYYDLKKEKFEEIKNENKKGFYFKDLGSEYLFKRSNRWIDFKVTYRYFAIVTDIIEGNGKWQDMCGSLEISQFKDGKLEKITNIGGISMDERIEIFQEKEKYLNKVVEIKSTDKNDKTYIDASFIRFRDDVKAEECVF